MKQTFVELLRESTLIQALLTLILVGVICYMYIVQIDVPDVLINVLTIIIGFYFGSKSQAKVESFVARSKRQ